MATTLGGFHVSYSFNQTAGPRSSGWTMNFWNSLTVLNDVLLAAGRLAPFLQAVVGKETLLEWYSARGVYEPPGSRGARLAASVYAVKPGGPPVPKQGDSDYPSVSLIMELRTQTGEVVRQTIRGIADDNVTLGGWYTPAGTMAGDIRALMTQLAKTGEGWAVRTQDQGQAPKPLAGFDSTVGNVTCPGHGFSVNQIVKIGGKNIGIKPKLNGRWKIFAVPDVDHFVLLDWENEDTAQSGNYRSAYAQALAFTYKAIAFDVTKPLSSGVTFVTSREVGRPQHRLTGRRKSRT